MSWIKRRGHPTPTQTPPSNIQMYNPNQHSNQDWQTPSTTNWYNQPMAQQPPQQTQPIQQPTDYWQQPTYNYQQPQQPQQPQQYTNQQLPPPQPQSTSYTQPQYNYQQPQLQPQQQQQQQQQQQPQQQLQQLQPQQQNEQQAADAWGGNWAWGDEDNNLQQQQSATNLNNYVPANANNTNNFVGDSFTNDESWNWNVEDVASTANQSDNQVVTNATPDPDELFPKMGLKARNKTPKTSDTLTPQWSIESQVSAESSDDVLQTSESDKSHMLSRSSTISHSPELQENKEIVHIGANKSPPPTSASKKRAIPPPPTATSSRSSYFSQSVNLETVPDNNELVDNNEVINERNQYLETGQLLDESMSVAPPPPGLSRMVLGQLEPPPGLSRMVLGQQNDSLLHRMIPGESSSPEQPHQRFDDVNVDENFEPSRAETTIGADTPPSNRSETQEDADVSAVVSSIRDLTVVGSEDTSVQQQTTSDRHETSDSGDVGEHQLKSPPSQRDDLKSKRDAKSSSSSQRRKYRDRYYDDDTDYYSDHHRRHRDDERKYSSLRRDGKDKEKRRREYGVGGGGSRRGDYYYDDYDEQRSRPSSRSDSVQDSNYGRHHHHHDRSDRDRYSRNHHRDNREHRDHRRQRDMFNPYMQGYNYDPYNNYYQQYQYQYLENLRRTNPQAYAEWYRKYYQQSSTTGAFTSMEEKTSVHSGRSSTNDDLAKERYLRQNYYGNVSLSSTSAHHHSMAGYYNVSSQYSGIADDSSVNMSRQYDYADSSLTFEETQPQRSTPTKFSTAHIKASITSGRLLKVLPHYPLDGQQALVEITNLQTTFSSDVDLKELIDFPGPLVKGITHKKTIIEYCMGKIRKQQMAVDCDGDVDSYVLMWELLILLIRQNGMVVGADIAELLMKNRSCEFQTNRRPPSVTSTNSSGNLEDVQQQQQPLSNSESVTSSTHQQQLKEEYVTSKFREFLLYGSGKEALEWAMKNSLWGHALFLASKLDKRTYANVMMRFANGLPMNDPLQTLYQLLSGRIPAAVTSVQDEKWGDWRPHLAMILSNTSQRPDLDRKAITTLADTLMARGSLYAAQFCYLMAEVGFGRYGAENAKMVLLGGNASKPFTQFATNEAIHMTEIYEYACTLNDATFFVPEFQAYKYLIATRLADYGYLETSLAYLEQIAAGMLRNPDVVQHQQSTLLGRVCELADRLKYYDPIVVEDDNGSDANVDLDSSRPDNSWLKELRAMQQKCDGLTPQNPDNHVSQQLNEHPDAFQPHQTHIEQTYQPQSWQMPESKQPQIDDSLMHQQPPQQDYSPAYDAQQQQQWMPDVAHNQWNQQPLSLDGNEPLDITKSNDYWGVAQSEQGPDDGMIHPSTLSSHKREDFQDVHAQHQQPQISMPNQTLNKYDDEFDAQKESSPVKTAPNKPAAQAVKNDKPASTGWFGGIWNRLALRPSNQMKLPDDKNPTIVWDQEKKRWVNLEEDNTDGASELKPPPKMSEMMMNAAAPHQQHQQPMHQQALPIHQQVQPIHHQQQQQQQLPQDNYNLGHHQQQQQQQHQQIGGGAQQTPVLSNDNVNMQQNMFKLQRNRNIKKAYVDVFNPGGQTAQKPSPNAMMSATSNAAPQPQMNFFIPAPISDPNAPTDFLTPSSSNNLSISSALDHNSTQQIAANQE